MYYGMYCSLCLSYLIKDLDYGLRYFTTSTFLVSVTKAELCVRHPGSTQKEEIQATSTTASRGEGSTFLEVGKDNRSMPKG